MRQATVIPYGSPERTPNWLREQGFRIEEALEKTPQGVSLMRPTAIMIRNALFAFADDIDRSS